MERKKTPTNFCDLTGKTFGELKVISRAEDYVTKMNKNRYTQWNCICICGNKKVVRANHLKSGKIKSCGCLKKKINSEIHTKDLMGQTFGRLTVIEKSDSYVSPDGHKQVKWICKCQCGNVVEVHSTSLVNKRTLSCGCLAKENAEKWKLKGLDDCYDDTRISLLNDTIYSKNTSGIRGVTYAKDKQKWEAQIEFKKKKIHLGYFNDKEMAAKVRKYAEERLWQPLLSDYKINAAIEDVQKYIKINYKK